jgi:hypothetical protein
MVKKHHIQNPTIFLLTDNIKAIDLFASAAPASWKITSDPTICSKVYTSKWDGSGTACDHSQQFHGTPGLAQLVALVIALEAKYFLLTMESNWSRMLDGLRLKLIEAPCKEGDMCSDVEYMGGHTLGYPRNFPPNFKLRQEFGDQGRAV